jgi:hypothetical protein
MFNPTTDKKDLTELPVDWMHRGEPLTGLVSLLLSVGIVALTVSVAIEIDRLLEFRPVFLVGVLIPISMLYLTLRNAKVSFERRYVTISDGEVSASLRGLTRRSTWQEPISAYDGVLQRVIVRQRQVGDTSHGYAVHQLLLTHPEPAKTLLLYETLQEAGVRAKWETTAAAFGLPALDASANSEEIVRDHEDFDKSIDELIAENKLDGTRPQGPPPSSCQVVEDGDRLEIRIRRSRLRAVPVVLTLAVSSGFVVLGLQETVPVAFAWFGMMFAGAVVVALVLTSITKPKLLIENGVLKWIEEVPWTKLVHGKMALGKLETIQRGRLSAEGADGLILESDDNTIQIASGLPTEVLDWLHRHILAHASDAHAGVAPGPVPDL